MKGIKTIAVVAGIGMVGYGSYRFAQAQYRRMLNYCYKIKNFKILKLTKDYIDVSFNLMLRNNSSLSVMIKGYDLNIYMNEKMIGTVKSIKPVLWAANSTSVIPVKASLNPEKAFTVQEIITLIANYISNKDKIKFSIRGKVSAGLSFIVIKNIPIDLTYTLTELLTDTPPDPELAKCQV